MNELIKALNELQKALHYVMNELIKALNKLKMLTHMNELIKELIKELVKALKKAELRVARIKLKLN